MLLSPWQALFVPTPILLCWNHPFRTSYCNVLSPLDGKVWNKRITKQMTQILKMPQQNPRPFLPLPLHPHNGWDVQLLLTTGHQGKLCFLPSWPTLHGQEGNTGKSFTTAAWAGRLVLPQGNAATVKCLLGELAQVSPKSSHKDLQWDFLPLTGLG